MGTKPRIIPQYKYIWIYQPRITRTIMPPLPTHNNRPNPVSINHPIHPPQPTQTITNYSPYQPITPLPLLSHIHGELYQQIREGLGGIYPSCLGGEGALGEWAFDIYIYYCVGRISRH